jgi:hypothetical protein
MSLWQWFINILIAIDQLINAILRGDPDETLSSRGGKALVRIEMGQGKPSDMKWYYLCRLLHIFDEDHCMKVLERDRGKRILGIKFPE